MGFVIVPTQPFGFNYLGGKLLAALCCSHEVREKLNKKYDMNLVCLKLQVYMVIVSLLVNMMV